MTYYFEILSGSLRESLCVIDVIRIPIAIPFFLITFNFFFFFGNHTYGNSSTACEQLGQQFIDESPIMTSRSAVPFPCVLATPG